jgi:hypothetical protein
MYKPELLKDLPITVECLKKELAGPDAEKVRVHKRHIRNYWTGFTKNIRISWLGSNLKKQRVIRTIF